jgi:hypothetical protein
MANAMSNDALPLPLQTVGAPRMYSERVGRAAVVSARRAVAQTIPPPSSSLRSFYRQCEAFTAHDISFLQAPEGVPWRGKLFSAESAGDGSRRFVFSTDVRLFWEMFRRMPPLSRHWYEVIRTDTPVHLYFDLEFKISAGAACPSLVGGALACEHLLWITALHLRARYGIECTRSDAVVLESSTPSKFSRHVVLRLPDGSRFRDASHAGAFVKSVYRSLEAVRASCSSVAAMWPATPNGAVASGAVASGDATSAVSGEADPPPIKPHGRSDAPFFADLGVYTRNRVMRMYLSCKFKKTARLLPASDNAYAPRSAAADGCQLANSFSELHDHWVPRCPCRTECIGSELAWERILRPCHSLTPPVLPAGCAAPTIAAAPVISGATSTSIEAIGGACSLSAMARGMRSETLDLDPLHNTSCAAPVQVGSLQWETQMWRGSLITDQLLPLWLEDAKVAFEAARPADATAWLQLHQQRHMSAAVDHRPLVHPHRGFRLLYCDDPESAGRGVFLPLVSSNREEGGASAELLSSSFAAPLKRRRLSSPFDVSDSSRRFEYGSTSGRDPPGSFRLLISWTLRELASGQRFCRAHDVEMGALQDEGSAPRSSLVDRALCMPKPATLRGWHAWGVELCASQSAPMQERRDDQSASDLAPPPTSVRVTTQLRLDIAGSHWCQRIGRHHRSNHVAWHINLVQHTAWQTCLDVECRRERYVSPIFSLPPELIPNQWPPGYREVSEARGEGDSDDAELCAFLDAHEEELLKKAGGEMG